MKSRFYFFRWLIIFVIVVTIVPQKARAAAPSCASPRLRKEIRDLTPEEWNAYTRAVVQLKRSGRYNDYITTHQTLANVAHNGENFFPWHRRFIYDFETDILNLTGTNLTGLPYFDPHESYDMFDPAAPYYVGNYTGCIADGPFAGFLRMNGQCVSRGYTSSISAVDPRVIAALILSNTDYQTFSQSYENGQHAQVHTAIGGVMATVPESPADPIFFLHHSHVDYVWYKRQWFDPQRLYWDLNGQQLNQPVTLNSLIPGPWQRNVGLGGQISDIFWTLCYDYQDPSGRNNMSNRRLARRQTETQLNGIFSPINESYVAEVKPLSESQLSQMNIDPGKHQQVVTNLNTIVDQLNKKLGNGEKVLSISDIQKSDVTPEHKVYASFASHLMMITSYSLVLIIVHNLVINFL